MPGAPCMTRETWPERVANGCAICHGRGWVLDEEIEEYLGNQRIPCLCCGGDGESESGGTCSFTCSCCLGTLQMPVSAIGEANMAIQDIKSQYWSGLDLSGSDLSGATFTRCNFARANFTAADLTQVTFTRCDFDGANPESAAALTGCRMQFTGLTDAQRAQCAARGATLVQTRGRTQAVPVQANGS